MISAMITVPATQDGFVLKYKFYLALIGWIDNRSNIYPVRTQKPEKLPLVLREAIYYQSWQGYSYNNQQCRGNVQEEILVEDQ